MGARKNRTSQEWAAIVSRAASIVESYDTGVTLRQLFYRLVSEGLLKNTKAEYGQLSSRTAEERRVGGFPVLIDRTRRIHQYESFTGTDDALTYIAWAYRRDRTEGQEYNIYLGVEKEGIVEQLRSWFGDYGVPIVALKGYSSQTYVDDVIEHVRQDGRPSHLIYAGDFDPSGEDIDRDFVERTGCFDVVQRIALNAGQIEEYNLPPTMGKESDSRADGFRERHGALVQVELDALRPEVLHQLYADEFFKLFDMSIFTAVKRRETEERESLLRLAS